MLVPCLSEEEEMSTQSVDTHPDAERVFIDLIRKAPVEGEAVPARAIVDPEHAVGNIRA